MTAPRLIVAGDTLPITRWRSYKATQWRVPSGINGIINAGAAPGAGSIRLFPAFIDQAVTLSALGVRVTTLSGAGNVQAAIYADGDPTTGFFTGLPLVSTASMSTGSAASVNAAASVSLLPGCYWWATNCDNGTAIFSSVSSASLGIAEILGSTSQSNCLTGSNAIVGFAVTQAFGTWPDLTGISPSSEVVNSSMPIVQIKPLSTP